MKYNKKRETKPKKRQVMHNAIAHHPLTNAQLVPEPRSAPPSQLLPVYILGMMSHQGVLLSITSSSVAL